MKLRVYKNEYGYSIQASNKQLGLKKYVPIQFKKGTEPEGDTADIEIKDAFFSVYKDKNNIGQIKLVVMEYEKGVPHEIESNDNFVIADNEKPLPF